MSQEPVETIRKFYEYLGQSNYEEAFALLHPEFELVQADSLPYGGTYVGVEGVKDFFKKLFMFWASFQSENVVYYEADEKVFATSLIVGTTQTGKDVRMPMVQIFEVQEGKMKSVRPFYLDTHQLIA